MDPIEYVNENTDFALCFFDLTHMVKKTWLSNHLSECRFNHLVETRCMVTKCKICLDDFKTLEVKKHMYEHLTPEKKPYTIIIDPCPWWSVNHLYSVCMYNENHVVKKSRLDSHLEKCQSKHNSSSLIRCCLCHTHFINAEIFEHLLLHKKQKKLYKYSSDGRSM